MYLAELFGKIQMAFPLEDTRTTRAARLDRERQALALFPSERDGAAASHNSVAGQMEAASLTDFPSEASVQLPKAEPAADRVVQADLTVAAGTSTGATQVTVTRAAEQPRGMVVSPRNMELHGGHGWSWPRFRALGGAVARAIVFTSAGATLGAFVGITAIVPATPVFKPQAAPLLRPTTSAPVTLETTSVEEASLEAAEARGAPPDRLNVRGALSVQADVAGAAIFVDGQLAGFTSITGWPVAVGSHVVRIELEGYRRWSAVSRIVADETNHLVAKLSPIEQNQDSSPSPSPR
jgi:hypothetical protein